MTLATIGLAMCMVSWWVLSQLLPSHPMAVVITVCFVAALRVGACIILFAYLWRLCQAWGRFRRDT
jgi:hypothetical protein